MERDWCLPRACQAEGRARGDVEAGGCPGGSGHDSAMRVMVGEGGRRESRACPGALEFYCIHDIEPWKGFRPMRGVDILFMFLICYTGLGYSQELRGLLNAAVMAKRSG